jgi:nitrate reductase (NAD(P)H)
MDLLLASGFITPPPLHYVRNHGAVPKISWSSHRLAVNGLVDRPLVLTMDDLVSLPAVTLPITFVCAGNRRKEENMLKKTIGFSWGPEAVSTSYWTGVRLADLLRLAGVRGRAAGAAYVSFSGPKAELPKGKDGSYGTSMRLPYALDAGNDVLIAYKQNGRWLLPDHGFPVRMLIPGWIGGRSVKACSHDRCRPTTTGVVVAGSPCCSSMCLMLSRATFLPVLAKQVLCPQWFQVVMRLV